MSRSVPRSLVCLGVIACAAASLAADLPPKEAPPFTGVYHLVSRSREAPGEEWKYMVDDTLTIAVLTKQSRWDHKNDGSTEINDSVSRHTTRFGGRVPAGTAIRSQAPYVPVNWEHGWATVRNATEKDPEVLGEATVAGRPCTRLKFVSEQYGEPEFCVAKNGIVLRFSNASSTAEATYEATSIDDKAPDQAKFVTPPDLRVEEQAGAPKRKMPF